LRRTLEIGYPEEWRETVHSVPDGFLSMIRFIMRNLLSLVALFLLAVSILGGWRGWIRVESLPSEPGRSAFRVEIDRSQMADDAVSVCKSVYRKLSGEKSEEATEAVRGK
jgi:hypothetical protein